MKPLSKTPYEVRSGYFSLGYEVEVALTQAQLPNAQRSIIILDAPFGFAMSELPEVEASRTLIATDNPCPEYWDDLWQMEPQVLLVRGTTLEGIVKALKQAVRGESFKRTPSASSLLSKKERSILRLCAFGFDTSEIAQRLYLEPRTVRNYLSSILKKLELSNRTQLPLYYWGLWHLLEGYRDETQPYVTGE